jgi:hypothetical protein
MSGADRGLAVGAMLSTLDDLPQRDRWARLRFAIIGPLLAAPPVAGELHEALTALAAKAWRHPFTGLEIRFGCSTLERWYYAAKRAADPVQALRNQVRGDIGRFPSLSAEAVQALTAQYRSHPGWTAQLHYDNLRVMLARGGEYAKPLLVGFIDDRSRFLCHAQWYPSEGTEELVHGLSHALQKVGLPRSLMTDRGSAMISGEFTAGLHHLGILHLPTSPYSPHVNGKQENIWGRVEGRLLAMLEGEASLTLEQLNVASQAWVTREYHRTVHSELGATPMVPTSAASAPGAMSCARRSASRSSATTPFRRHGESRSPALRDPIPVSASRSDPSALCPLGLERRRSDRRAFGPSPVSGASAG